MFGIKRIKEPPPAMDPTAREAAESLLAEDKAKIAVLRQQFKTTSKAAAPLIAKRDEIFGQITQLNEQIEDREVQLGLREERRVPSSSACAAIV